MDKNGSFRQKFKILIRKFVYLENRIFDASNWWLIGQFVDIVLTGKFIISLSILATLFLGRSGRIYSTKFLKIKILKKKHEQEILTNKSQTNDKQITLEIQKYSKKVQRKVQKNQKKSWKKIFCSIFIFHLSVVHLNSFWTWKWKIEKERH